MDSNQGTGSGQLAGLVSHSLRELCTVYSSILTMDLPGLERNLALSTRVPWVFFLPKKRLAWMQDQIASSHAQMNAAQPQLQGSYNVEGSRVPSDWLPHHAGPSGAQGAAPCTTICIVFHSTYRMFCRKQCLVRQGNLPVVLPNLPPGLLQFQATWGMFHSNRCQLMVQVDLVSPENPPVVA